MGLKRYGREGHFSKYLFSHFPFWKHIVVLRIQKSAIKSIRMGRVGTQTEGKPKPLSPTALQKKNKHTKGTAAGGGLKTHPELLFVSVVVWPKHF